MTKSEELRKDFSVDELVAARQSLRDERTGLAVHGGLVPSVYNERLDGLNLRIEALNKAIWHLKHDPEEK